MKTTHDHIRDAVAVRRFEGGLALVELEGRQVASLQEEHAAHKQAELLREALGQFVQRLGRRSGSVRAREAAVA